MDVSHTTFKIQNLFCEKSTLIVQTLAGARVFFLTK